MSDTRTKFSFIYYLIHGPMAHYFKYGPIGFAVVAQFPLCGSFIMAWRIVAYLSRLRG